MRVRQDMAPRPRITHLGGYALAPQIATEHVLIFGNGDGSLATAPAKIESYVLTKPTNNMQYTGGTVQPPMTSLVLY